MYVYVHVAGCVYFKSAIKESQECQCVRIAKSVLWEMLLSQMNSSSIMLESTLKEGHKDVRAKF